MKLIFKAFETNAKKYLQRHVPTYKLIKNRRCGFKQIEHMKFQFSACKRRKIGKYNPKRNDNLMR